MYPTLLLNHLLQTSHHAPVSCLGHHQQTTTSAQSSTISSIKGVL
ncbi:unnamed protein product [Callosobruchus maculatus]|uniref:Uncharacterized protein n=1 Tax=Callosobruchus maculatus TaxID=64391 RepID=A0A653C2G1_CALMS|nr:unnamed protein product [Callosobruchus maculatus]